MLRTELIDIIVVSQKLVKERQDCVFGTKDYIVKINSWILNRQSMFVNLYVNATRLNERYLFLKRRKVATGSEIFEMRAVLKHGLKSLSAQVHIWIQRHWLESSTSTLDMTAQNLISSSSKWHLTKQSRRIKLSSRLRFSVTFGIVSS